MMWQLLTFLPHGFQINMLYTSRWMLCSTHFIWSRIHRQRLKVFFIFLFFFVPCVKMPFNINRNAGDFYVSSSIKSYPNITVAGLCYRHRHFHDVYSSSMNHEALFTNTCTNKQSQRENPASQIWMLLWSALLTTAHHAWQCWQRGLYCSPLKKKERFSSAFSCCWRLFEQLVLAHGTRISDMYVCWRFSVMLIPRNLW